MGFPACYSEMLAPKLLLRLVLALGYLRSLISWALDLLGLGDLLDPNDPCSHHNPPIPPPDALHDDHHHNLHPKFQSFSAMLIRELLPAVPYEELHVEQRAAATECVVCLCEFEGEEEVRPLTNCRHLFHRCCLDRWAIDHEQRTCPLCRSPLFPQEMAEMVAGPGGVWAAAAGLPDSLSGGDEYDDLSPEVFGTPFPVFFS